MLKITVTLNLIRKHSPCEEGWKKLLLSLGKTQADDAPITISRIAESNGLDDAIWCLRALPYKHHKKIGLFACDVAEGALAAYEKFAPDDTRIRDCIAITRKFLQGKATRKELDNAAADAADAARAARAARAADAARAAYAADAADAARAAADAAYAARAAYAAADAAADAADAADAAYAAQLKLLIKYFG